MAAATCASVKTPEFEPYHIFRILRLQVQPSTEPVKKRKGAALERRLPTRRLPKVLRSVARGASKASLLRGNDNLLPTFGCSLS